jgi:hypothetical protein
LENNADEQKQKRWSKSQSRFVNFVWIAFHVSPSKVNMRNDSCSK